MIQIDNLDAWISDYFSQPENIKKSEKACERYDRLMVKQIRRQLTAGTETINIHEIDDPGKCLEKTKYEILPNVTYGDEEGKLKINLLDKTGEFIKKA